MNEQNNNYQDTMEKVKALTDQIGPLQQKLAERRVRYSELRQNKKDLADQRRALRRTRREFLQGNDPDAADRIEAEMDGLEEKAETLEKEMDIVEEEIDDIKDEIEDIEEEIDELLEDFDDDDIHDEKFFKINIGGKDLRDELNKAMSKLSEVKFDEVGESIGRAVDKAVNSINRGVTDAFQNMKHNPDNGDYFFSGSGSLPTGDYGRLHFSGSGRLTGDISCAAIKASGSLNAEGSIRCDGEIRTSGSTSCVGDISARSFKSSGSVRIDGGYAGKSIDVSGSLAAGRDIKSDEVRAGGSLTVGGDCEAEKFFSAGKLNIDGLLNADDIEIRLSTIPSKVSSIGCERIRITRRSVLGLAAGLGIQFGPGLTTESIEGDVIYLENVTAKIVRGKEVVIGGGCNIDLIEYSGKCEVSGNSTVGETKFV